MIANWSRDQKIDVWAIVIPAALVIFGWFIIANSGSEKKIERSEIIKLAQMSMWKWNEKETTGGDAGAFDELLRLKEDLENEESELASFTEDQIVNVISNYRNIDKISLFPALVMPSGKPGYLYYDLQLKTADIIDQAFSDNAWVTHAKAAYLLGYRQEKSVPLQ